VELLRTRVAVQKSAPALHPTSKSRVMKFLSLISIHVFPPAARLISTPPRFSRKAAQANRHRRDGGQDALT
jgi:hypothetical protein